MWIGISERTCLVNISRSKICIVLYRPTATLKMESETLLQRLGCDSFFDWTFLIHVTGRKYQKCCKRYKGFLRPLQSNRGCHLIHYLPAHEANSRKSFQSKNQMNNENLKTSTPIASPTLPTAGPATASVWSKIRDSNAQTLLPHIRREGCPHIWKRDFGFQTGVN